MEQEPVYVPADRLESVCQEVLGKIYDIRQANKENYIRDRTQQYNQLVAGKNKWRKFLSVFGVKPYMLIDEAMMEQLVLAEVRMLSNTNVQMAQQHPITQIYGEYGGLEHQAKDCIIQCAMNESVPVSADMVRGISHLGIPLTFMRRTKMGFIK